MDFRFELELRADQLQNAAIIAKPLGDGAQIMFVYEDRLRPYLKIGLDNKFSLYYWNEYKRIWELRYKWTERFVNGNS